ncbi:hypothetical protein [Actibacterium lipolyticum]|uniref:Uncharacterized protein n=1 Tax=Actibacterium lipolyticum TaxID=1524263 RepID=A0A238KK09_9RHOB|nr:hypothetical protein [Actibacterium lipolyticum]SMX43113.1 hypothetical protein COL8621_02217 [Actibacterium lipolyticum]
MTAPTNGPDAQTDTEKSVKFINAEVLDPGTQQTVSFVKPFYEQTLVMALEDARSFVQGAEQILLVALAKALEKAISGGASLPETPAPLGSPTHGPSVDDTLAQQPPSDVGLKAVESAMTSLANFHSTIAETAHKFNGDI